MDVQPEDTAPAPDAGDIPSFQQLLEAELAISPGLSGPRRKQVLVPVAELERLLPRFERFGFLGAGGMGIVYKAWQKDLRRWVAVKLLGPDLAEDPRALERFRNEASILAQLRHPNIVPIHDYGDEGDVAFLVMEYIEGVSLKAWADQQKPSVRQTAEIMALIARATGVAHASGITHRDLKPSNILITRDHQPVIIDFGLAQHAAWQKTTRFTRTGELAGTVAYLAPEQLEPSVGEVSPATDVHACGIMAFEVLAGALPRKGSTSQIIAQLHSDEFPPRLRLRRPAICKELEAVCWKAMQRDPRDRYASGSALADDLDRFNKGLPVQAQRPSLLRMVWQGVRRRPGRTFAFGICVSAVLLAAASARQAAIDQRKSELVTQLNRCLTATDWTPERLQTAEALLAQFAELAPEFARHMREDLLNRTAAEITRDLSRPEPTRQEMGTVRGLVEFLKAHLHPQAPALEAVWQARQKDWQTVVSLETPLNAQAVAAAFPGATYSLDAGGIRFQSTSVSLDPGLKIRQHALVDAEFSGPWPGAAEHGLVLRLPGLPDLRFHVFDADRFAQIEPNFRAGGSPVAAIMRGEEPLVYKVLPESFGGDRLQMTASFEDGQIALKINNSIRVEFNAVFMHALPTSTIAIVLPAESRLCALEVKERHPEGVRAPLAQADDLVEMGKLEQALPMYERFVNDFDRGLEANYKRGCCLNALGREQEAAAAWKAVAAAEQEPWRSLACLDLWRAAAGEGSLQEADDWFDLLVARPVPPLVRASVLQSDRVLFDDTYRHVTRSLNCLSICAVDLPALERSIAVQKFLGSNPRQIAAQTAAAFHFAGADERSRQMFAAALTPLRPDAVHGLNEADMALTCLDQWASLGGTDQDAAFQAIAASWRRALAQTHSPFGAALRLEEIRSQLRNKTADPQILVMLDEVASDRSAATRFRVDARLVAGFAHKHFGQAKDGRRQWRQAAAIVDKPQRLEDATVQLLLSELAARTLAQAWDERSAMSWFTAMVAKSAPAGSAQSWTGGMMQSVSASSLARVLNAMWHGDRGNRFARDSVLRQRPARDLACEGLELFFDALLREGSALPAHDPLPTEVAKGIARAFSVGQFDGVTLMQFFKLWGGAKTFATWDLAAKSFPPGLRAPMAALMRARFLKLGQQQEVAEFEAGGRLAVEAQ